MIYFQCKSRYDPKQSGFVDVDDMEKAFKKLKLPLRGSESRDLLDLAEARWGVEYGIIVALAQAVVDPGRAVARVR